MFGYVTTFRDELKVKDMEVYNGYYCGLCKRIGQRCGQVPRVGLTFDMAFLALLLASLTEETDEPVHEHCIIHHLIKKPVIKGGAEMDYAADMSLLLTYKKFADNWQDEKSLKSLGAMSIFYRGYRKAAARHPAEALAIEKDLSELSLLEEENSTDLDMVCGLFGNIMVTVMTGFPGQQAAKANAVIKELAVNLGKWIYIVDAADDLEKDRKAENYNPLLALYDGYGNEKIRAEVKGQLYYYLAQVANAYDLLEVKKNKDILENIFFMGLRQRTDVVLGKGARDEQKSL